MRRLRPVVASAAALGLAATGVAFAHTPHATTQHSSTPKFTKITGGTTQVTLTSAAASGLQSAGLTVTPIAPATASGASITFPISGGRINLQNLHGVVRHQGGFSLVHGTTTRAVRELTIISNGKTAGLYARVRVGTAQDCRRITRHHHNGHCVSVTLFRELRLAKITGVAIKGQSATGQAVLTAAAANLLDKLSGTSAFKAGQVIGTVTVSPTFASSSTTTTTTTTSSSSTSSTYVDPLK